MQVCPKCEKVVKYIAVSNNKIILCESEKKEFITEKGRVFEGFMIHNCSEAGDDGREKK